MERIAIIGAGLIGRAWATVYARAGHTVRMYDSAPGAVERAAGLVLEGLEDLRRAGLVSEAPRPSPRGSPPRPAWRRRWRTPTTSRRTPPRTRR